MSYGNGKDLKWPDSRHRRAEDRALVQSFRGGWCRTRIASTPGTGTGALALDSSGVRPFSDAGQWEVMRPADLKSHLGEAVPGLQVRQS